MMEIQFHDPRARDTLWTGRWKDGNVEKVAILRAVSALPVKTLHFDLKDESELQVPNLLKRLFVSCRAISLTATLAPALVTFMFGSWIEGWAGDAVSFAFSFFSLLFLHLTVNILNDVEDHLNLVDLPGDIGGSAVIQKGWLSAKTLSRLAYGCLTASIVFGSYPLLKYWHALLPLVLASAVGALGYSGFWFRFKYRALGDLVVFLLCGPLLVIGVSVASFGKVSSGILILGAVFGIASVGILHANNLNDIEVDSARGAITVANQIGFKSSKKYLVWIYLLIVAMLGLGVHFNAIPLWFSMVPAIASVPVFFLLSKVSQAMSPLSPVISKIRFEAAQIHLMIGASWGVALLLQHYFK